MFLNDFNFIEFYLKLSDTIIIVIIIIIIQVWYAESCMYFDKHV